MWVQVKNFDAKVTKSIIKYITSIVKVTTSVVHVAVHLFLRSQLLFLRLKPIFPGYRVFALQDGGECYSSEDALNTYRKYGPSEDCLEDGQGGFWANHIYMVITG